MVRSSFILFNILLLLLAVVASSSMPLSAELRSDQYVVRRYGPILIYHSGGVSLMLFDEGFFNYSYRNVYIYITDGYEIDGERHIGELLNDVAMYFSINPFSTISVVGIDNRSIAEYFNKQIGRPIISAVKNYNDKVLIVVRSIKGLDEGVKLLDIGRKISSMYGKNIEIVSTSPFDGFFNGRYNGSMIAEEAVRAVKEIGLGKAIRGAGVWIPALRIYAVFELDKDELDRIAKSNNTDTNTVIKRIVDAIRTRIPEDIPLSIIVEKTGRIEFLTAPTRSATIFNIGIAIAIAITALIPLILIILHIVRK